MNNSCIYIKSFYELQSDHILKMKLEGLIINTCYGFYLSFRQTFCYKNDVSLHLSHTTLPFLLIPFANYRLIQVLRSQG